MQFFSLTGHFFRNKWTQNRVQHHGFWSLFTKAPLLTYASLKIKEKTHSRVECISIRIV